ncbi:MAG: phosphoribosylformylglycinamidine synthase [Flavobacteriaceae bacterium]|nr:phosphoribosylformylglycinamidine synthase [Flavobacteriaceae bacterium]
MIQFFQKNKTVFAVLTKQKLTKKNTQKLVWLFANAKEIKQVSITAFFVGPRKEMITPWSTNAVEITQNMGVKGIIRIEKFKKVKTKEPFDTMISSFYQELHQEIFTINTTPVSVLEIEDIAKYNKQEGLALNKEEVTYLEELSKKLNRKLTDGEVFGFSQVNSEHCRHKIFNGIFVINAKEKPNSLFKMIKKTSAESPEGLISAYKDNVAFIKGPTIVQFAPKTFDKPDFYEEKYVKSVISLKAETHNFPTTVEPFNGAATGSGGEIRDRLAGGKGSLPLAGTAVYMTSYSRLNNFGKNQIWESQMQERPWLYQTPIDILIKASNGASDFGNKFGQPLICGSVLTFENETKDRKLGYDKVIMQAGGIGYGKEKDSLKDKPQKDDAIVILGGDNYRIGMGGAAVSSADTGNFSNAIELNAIQRSNPEMQKRVANTIRAMVESDNKIISIHDHGAGGHLNCLSELVEETGGIIKVAKLPIGDKTLSDKEIIANESQERMGLIINKKNLELLTRIAERERSPIYEVGKVTTDNRFLFVGRKGKNPIDLHLSDMFGSSPKTIMNDKTVLRNYTKITYDETKIYDYVAQVLQLEAVACKDWLTNKVDRCVTGKVAKQQTCGSLQLPLNNVGVMALDYKGQKGIATSIGHAPIAALVNEVSGSRNAIAEALTNIIFAPLEENLDSVSLSANWMWPCKNEGEDARLYNAVEAVSNFAIALGINIPTGKDSLSMKQKYDDYDVISPGTVIISATGQCSDVTNVIEPVLQKKEKNTIYYINFSQDEYHLGGSTFGQILSKIGQKTPTIKEANFFKNAFNAVQELIKQKLVIAGHDISAGGLITTLLEMCFADLNLGANIDLSKIGEQDLTKLLFAENSGIIFQTDNATKVESFLKAKNIAFFIIGFASDIAQLNIVHNKKRLEFNVDTYRDIWYKTSFLLDQKQSGKTKAKERFDNYKKQDLQFRFPKHFTGKLPKKITKRPIAAVIREKGSNSEREMAYAMYLAGFNVKDVHMTDLISGRETLEDIQFIVAVGGFSNSDVLGSAKGWAGAFLYNEKAKKALANFFARPNTLSLGVCNGCQLFIELGLINQNHKQKPKMLQNDSGKFECNFTSVVIQPNNSVLFKTMSNSKLGIWVAHGEGKFSFPYTEDKYNIVAKYAYKDFPANPNGSDFNTAFLTSDCGRHTVMMPHLERSTFKWNWANYPKNRNNDEITPWLEGFVNARKFINLTHELEVKHP